MKDCMAHHEGLATFPRIGEIEQAYNVVKSDGIREALWGKMMHNPPDGLLIRWPEQACDGGAKLWHYGRLLRGRGAERLDAEQADALLVEMIVTGRWAG